MTGETAGTYSAELLPHHLKMIQDSAVTPEVAAERGYRSAESRADLKRCGFSDSQCLVPGLLIPIRGVNGDIVNYQLRPDSPRMSKGKALKYETPTGSRMALDVPSRARANLRNPAVPLFVTEGSRKADAGVSKGLCCIAVSGVWNWRGTNADGGKTALPDWEMVALNERPVYIVFDSDAMTKPEVHTALTRISAFLESRGAKVRYVYLPRPRAAPRWDLMTSW